MKNMSTGANHLYESIGEDNEDNTMLLTKRLRISKQDLLSIAKLIELRNKAKPEMPLEQFVLFLTYLAELNFLSEEAYQGFKKFYKNDEMIKTRLDDLGKIFADVSKEAEEGEDPIEWMIVEYVTRYYAEKAQHTISVVVDRDTFCNLMEIATEEEAKEFGKGLMEKANNYIKDYYKKIKDKRMREKIRGKR